MQAHTKAWRRLLRDKRGAVSLEYLVITVITLAMTIAVAGLSVALMRAELRANNVLRSNTP